ncbi:MAG TPA: hypothetical protein VMH83_13460 [Candidatus Acidoferrum sp.]|nr:hypothetical protein [Candidatus Acidoferrum sp.]
MATQSPPPFRTFWQPRHWPTWIALGLLYVTAWLPYDLRMLIGKALGLFTYALARERRYITTVNIRRCFPELTPEAQDSLILHTFLENGIGLVETATGWMRPPQHFQHLLILSGTEHLDDALKQGRGVLMLGAHYTTLDFSANLLGAVYPFAVTYRPHRNPLFDAFMLRGRLRNCNGVFDRRDIRGAFRHLKQNKILWYAPDQDYGPDQAVFAPFFGRTAATITAMSRFAAFNDSPTVVVRHHRLDDKRRYVIEFMKVEPPFPSGDEVADATRINRMLETAIRMAPAQYLWMHKRFKTQPHGKPQSPYILIATPQHKLDRGVYEKFTAESSPLPHANRLQLRSGLQLWLYDGVARGLFARRHPVRRLDALSKHLRSQGVVTVTVDSLFLFKFRKQSGATCHIPRGEPAELSFANPLTPQRAALFLARIHDADCHFLQMERDNLLLYNNRLALLDPLCLARKWRIDSAHRINDLRRLWELLSYDVEQRAQCFHDYLQQSYSVNAASLQALMPSAEPVRSAS